MCCFSIRDILRGFFGNSFRDSFIDFSRNFSAIFSAFSRDLCRNFLWIFFRDSWCCKEILKNVFLVPRFFIDSLQFSFRDICRLLNCNFFKDSIWDFFTSSSRIIPGVPSGFLPGVPSGISFGILSFIFTGCLLGISSNIPSSISLGIPS